VEVGCEVGGGRVASTGRENEVTKVTQRKVSGDTRKLFLYFTAFATVAKARKLTEVAC
jgi:hypothetical protein